MTDNKTPCKDVTYEVLHRVANAGAERFLELLTREK